MTIYGVALLAICTLIGVALGDLLGMVLHVKANVGGVGVAMILLIAARVWLTRKGALSAGIKLGTEFWATMYIPIVVAMAAQQNVLAAAHGGPMVIIAAFACVFVCGAVVALISRFDRGNTGSDGPPPDPFIEDAAIAGPSGPLPVDPPPPVHGARP
jgi:malonate transporter MadL subunit